jgi:ribosome-binding factor A
MPQGARTERVGEEFREILAEAIQRLKDPRIGFVTVTGVKVSHDLRVAWVYFTALGDERARAGSRAGLRSASPHLRRELGRQIRLKVVPELWFEEDTTPATAERVDTILEGIHEQEAGRDA